MRIMQLLSAAAGAGRQQGCRELDSSLKESGGSGSHRVSRQIAGRCERKACLRKDPQASV